MAHSPTTSVGIVTPQVFHFKDPLILRSGKVIPSYDLITESYGELNKKRDNAILVCHALSGDHHAAGFHSETDRKPGWWDSAIGPGKAIDTNLFYRFNPKYDYYSHYLHQNCIYKKLTTIKIIYVAYI